MAPHIATRITALVTACLFAASVWVVWEGAEEEPYTAFHARDAIVQIGVASALIALWLAWLGFIGAQVAKKKLPLWWLATFVLSAIALYGLYDCPAGYISDLVTFHVVAR